MHVYTSIFFLYGCVVESPLVPVKVINEKEMDFGHFGMLHLIMFLVFPVDGSLHDFMHFATFTLLILSCNMYDLS